MMRPGRWLQFYNGTGETIPAFGAVMLDTADFESNLMSGGSTSRMIIDAVKPSGGLGVGGKKDNVDGGIINPIGFLRGSDHIALNGEHPVPPGRKGLCTLETPAYGLISDKFFVFTILDPLLIVTPFTVNAPVNVIVTLIQDGGPGVDEVQQIALTSNNAVTGGTFTLTWDSGNGDETTDPIQWDATAAQVLQALENLSTPVIGDFTVTGGPGPDAYWEVTFIVTFAATNVNQISGDASSVHLLGGTPNSSSVITIAVPLNDQWYLQSSSHHQAVRPRDPVFTNDWSGGFEILGCFRVVYITDFKTAVADTRVALLMREDRV